MLAVARTLTEDRSAYGALKERAGIPTLWAWDAGIDKIAHKEAEH
jgi:hypothetical protein